MAITVKKNRTLKLKSAADVNKKLAESESAADLEKPSSLQDPAANLGVVVKKANYVPDVICAIFAVLCFGALILFQYLEISYYQQPPRVWPLAPMVGGASSGGSIPTPSGGGDEMTDEEMVAEELAAEEEAAEEEAVEAPEE